MARCQCIKCEETFSSESGFNAHRVATAPNKRKCLSLRGIRGKGMVKRGNIWHWSNAGYGFKLDSEKSRGLK